MKILKAILLISAFLAVVLRLFTYENSDFIGEDSTGLLNILAIAAAVVCVAAALIWAYLLKKEEKASKNENADSEETADDNTDKDNTDEE